MRAVDLSCETAELFDIVRGSYVDGPGLRTTVFFKGCNLKCKWCHNPESQNSKPQMLFYPKLCTGCGTCKKVCPNGMKTCTLCGVCVENCPNGARRIAGKSYTLDEVMSQIAKDKSFYKASDGGITCSGGECMLQMDFLYALLRKCHDLGIHTAVDTAGNVGWDCFERILPVTDLFLYDVKCADEKVHEKYTGVTNKLILENLYKLSEVGAKVLVRVPLISGVNDTQSELDGIAEILRRAKPQGVEVLPYHRLGEGKQIALGREPEIFDIPSSDSVKNAKEKFNNALK